MQWGFCFLVRGDDFYAGFFWVGVGSVGGSPGFGLGRGGGRGGGMMWA